MNYLYRYTLVQINCYTLYLSMDGSLLELDKSYCDRCDLLNLIQSIRRSFSLAAFSPRPTSRIGFPPDRRDQNQLR
jgi:hypothetical protein